MRKVELRMNEQEKYETIKYVVEHNGSKKRASIKLGISIRQVNRLIIIYKEKVKLALFTATELVSQLMLLITQSPRILYYFITINIKILILDIFGNI